MEVNLAAFTFGLCCVTILFFFYQNLFFYSSITRCENKFALVFVRTTFIFAALFVVCLFNKQLEKQIADDEVVIFQRFFKAAVSLLSTALASAASLLKGVLDKLHLVFRSRNSLLNFSTCQPIHYSKDPLP